jgi:fumarate hydratase class II
MRELGTPATAGETPALQDPSLLCRALPVQELAGIFSPFVYNWDMSGTLQGWAQVLALGAIMVGALVYQTHYIDKVIEGLRNEINERFKTMEERFAGLRAELKAEIAGLRAEINQRFNNVETRLDRIEHPVVRG